MPQTFSLHLHYVDTLSWESQKSKNVVVQTADIDWLTNIVEVCQTTSQICSWILFSWMFLHHGDFFIVIIFAPSSFFLGLLLMFSRASGQGGAGSAAAPPTFAVLEQCSPISLAMWQTDGDDYLLVDFYNFTGVVVVSLLLTCSRRFMIQIYLSTRFRHKMLTLFRGWPVMVNVTHTRRRRSICVICGFTLFLWKSELIRNCE